MINRTPFTEFGKTKLVPLNIYRNGVKLSGETFYDKTWWVERPEDWYALASDSFANKNILVVERKDWLVSPEIKAEPEVLKPKAVDNFDECLQLITTAYHKACGGHYEPKSIRDTVLASHIHHLLEQVNIDSFKRVVQQVEHTQRVHDIMKDS